MSRIKGNKLTDSDDVKFWRLVEKTSGCWLWRGSLASKRGGYGIFSPRAKRSMRAHRYSWQIHHGPVPEGLDVCHKCDNPPCVNPDHLFVGTVSDNMQDALRKNRLTCGVRSPSAKLTMNQVEEIRTLRRENGLTMRELGLRFGVTVPSVWRVLHYTSYRIFPNGANETLKIVGDLG